jgi:hypothetical protein
MFLPDKKRLSIPPRLSYRCQCLLGFDDFPSDNGKPIFSSSALYRGSGFKLRINGSIKRLNSLVS